MVQLQKILGVFDDPVAVDPHVVGDHVTGQADAPLSSAFAQIAPGVFTAQVGRDPVFTQGVGAGGGFGVAHVLLDQAGGF